MGKGAILLLHAWALIISKEKIMIYIDNSQLKTGDRIVEPIFQTGLSKHHAIYIGQDELGQGWIVENHKVHGVHLMPARDFFTATKTYRIYPFIGSQAERNALVKKALSKLGTPYSLLNYNCEHFANEVLYGRKESQQAKNGIGIMAGILILGWLFSK